MSLFQCINLEMVMIRAEQKLTELTNSDKSQIFLVDYDNNQLIRYESDKNVTHHEKNIGIIGECLKSSVPIATARPYIDPSFNSKVDIDTELSLLTVPVKSEEMDQIVAIFQFIDVHSSISKQFGRSTSFDMEIINFFIKIFSICIENASNIRKQMENLKENSLSKDFKKKTYKRMSAGE